jgi:hypothetical protein
MQQDEGGLTPLTELMQSTAVHTSLPGHCERHNSLSCWPDQLPPGCPSLILRHPCFPPLHRADNLFRQLDERQLTDQEEKIIQQRVRAPALARRKRRGGDSCHQVPPTYLHAHAPPLFSSCSLLSLLCHPCRFCPHQVELQRMMFREYERREQSRKVQELMSVMPSLDEEAARRALHACNWREDEATIRFSSDPVFQRMVLRSGE